MSRKRREGGGGGRGAGPGDHHGGGGGKGSGPGADAVSMDGGLREVSVSVVFSVWCLLFLLRSQFLHSQTDDDPSSGSFIFVHPYISGCMLAWMSVHADPSTIHLLFVVMLHCS